MAPAGTPPHVNIVRFPVEFDFPTTQSDDLANAAEAVKREYRSSVRWKRLRCRSVTLVSKTNAEAIYVLEIGQSVEFDWTWEGATAFRPVDIDNFNGYADTTDDFLGNVEGDEPGHVWSGEVVEVDEANGRVFVWVSDPTSPPTTGSFFVRPFEFLAFLYAIYCNPAFNGVRRFLHARLNASRGDVHPLLPIQAAGGLDSLQRLWAYHLGNYDPHIVPAA